MFGTTLFARRLRHRALLLVVLVALLGALLPSAVFAAGSTVGLMTAEETMAGRYRQDKWDGHHSTWDNGKYEYRYDRNRKDDKHYNRCDTTYRVRRGDTLSEISRHFRVSVHELTRANNIRNPNRIFAGQVLCVPR